MGKEEAQTVFAGAWASNILAGLVSRENPDRTPDMKPMGTEQPRRPGQPSRAPRLVPANGRDREIAHAEARDLSRSLAQPRDKRSRAHPAMTGDPDNLTNGGGDESGFG
ncbi:hypothetical protein LY76DRAFT_608336 [Colletotrichum caudatum]|nr:hypothetical protein LY76DRAFT_608336 [Colletotrichum caudatum]